MNRKTETILAWIANGLSIIYLLLTCLSLLVMKSGQNQQQYKDIMKQMYGNNQNVSSDILLASMMISIGFLAFSTILGIFGALTIKGRKNLAGALLIAAAVTGLITMNFIAMILWIIAAIMLFSKKKDHNNNAHYNQSHNRDQFNDNYHENKQSHNEEWDPDKELKNHKKDDPYIY